MAYRSLKTPTAVADFIIDRNVEFETRLEEQCRWIHDEALDMVTMQRQHLSDLSHGLKHGIHSRIKLEENKLSHLHTMIKSAGAQLLSIHHKKIDFMHTLLSAVDPDQVLARGFTITTRAGQTITQSIELEKGDQIETIFHDGNIKSIVE